MAYVKKRKLNLTAVLILILAIATLTVGGIFIVKKFSSSYPKELVKVSKKEKNMGKHKIDKEIINGDYYVFHYPKTGNGTLDKWIGEEIDASKARYKEKFEVKENEEEVHKILQDYTSSKTDGRFYSVTLTTKVDDEIVNIQAKTFDTEEDKIVNSSIFKPMAARLITSELRASVKAEGSRQEFMAKTLVNESFESIHINDEIITFNTPYGAYQLNIKEKPSYLNVEIGDVKPTNDYLPSVYLAQGVNPNDKLVALTFDDGPHKTNTPRLLEIFDKYDAKATFFLLGELIPKNPDIVKSMLDKGHQVANHSYDHQSFSKIGLQATKDQIARTNEEIFKATGYRENFYVRPPYGALNEEVRQGAGVTFAFWSVDTEDWRSRNAATVCNVTEKSTRDGSIVLMHDIHATTIDSLDCVLSTLQKQGYKFVTMQELLEARGYEVKEGQKYFYGALQ